MTGAHGCFLHNPGYDVNDEILALWREHLPRLLDRIAQGESLTITRHGKPVARLVPATGDRKRAKERRPPSHLAAPHRRACEFATFTLDQHRLLILNLR